MAKIVDQYGNALRSNRQRDLPAHLARAIHARYDAAQTSDEFKTYWANADAFDADSAHNQQVRHTLVKRSRYELANNGYADGIAQTYANDLVGIGPSLRMQTGSPGFNQLVEREWRAWTKAIHFRRKLWTMAHAKHGDGEAFGVIRRNPRVNHPVKLDLVLHETEQIQTPMVPLDDGDYIDGIKFDQFGNPLWYDLLTQHPGTTGTARITFDPERIPANRMLHWFKMRRPGQHRQVPETSSTLNLGAAARRYRESNLSTAEKIANFTLFLKSIFPPSELDDVEPMEILEMAKGMMTTLPNNLEPLQLKAEHPPATFEAFHKILVNEQARPKSMPYNKAACDSSDYNFASGRLDHQTYYAEIDVDREDGDDLVLDPLFDVWFEASILVFGWLGGNPEAVSPSAKSHGWDWPKHRVADVKSEASANETKLKTGQVGLHQIYSEAGMDLEDELPKMAETYGVTVDEMRTRLLDAIFPPKGSAETPNPPPEEATPIGAILPRNGHNSAKVVR